MPRVNDEYYEKKRNEIIEAAYRVCVRKPITSVEMKDIIAETGFSHGAIYRYYKDLDEVLLDLVISVNSRNRIDDKLDQIIEEGKGKNWEIVIRNVFKMLSDYMLEVGIDVQKLSLHCDMLAMSDPDRVDRISQKLGKDNQSPLIYLVARLSEYLNSMIRDNDLSPKKTVDEIIQYIIVTYHGIQAGFVLSGCFKTEYMEGKYKPEEMFSCLADSVILMMGGNDDVL